MLSDILPSAGRLLVSEPFMPDPNFKRSVVLLTDFADTGAVGFVLNQQSEYLLGDLLPGLSYAEFPVFIGGPVANDTLHFIHRSPEKIPGGIAIGNGLFWGGDFDQLKTMVTSYQLTENDIKFFIGYSGWSEGQLQNELAQDSWIVTDKYNPDALFSNDEQGLWKEVVISMGQRFAHIANFPENPMLN